MFLIVNIDESLFKLTTQIRKNILLNIILDISNASQQPYSEDIKERILKNIKLIKELMAET